MSLPALPKPKNIFAADHIVYAACLLALYPEQVRYERCVYRFDLDEYHFWFSDNANVGRELMSELRATRDPLVPAKAYRVALNRLYRDFRNEQKRVGNPNSASDAIRQALSDLRDTKREISELLGGAQ